MAEPGRLDLVKDSLDVMTDRLRDDDAVALVTFSDEAETVLPMTRLGDHRGRVHDAIDTPGAHGLDQPRRGRHAPDTAPPWRACARAPPTGSYCSPTPSPTPARPTPTPSSTASRDARREHGITLFGVGVGSDYGDALMERLADKGDGHTTYVSNAADARTVFCDQLPRNIDLTARDAKAQVAFDPETVEQFRLIGYDNRQVADEDFRDDRVDGGEIGPGHTVTALYAVRTRPGASGHLATATVRWLDPKTRVPHEETGQVETRSLDRPLWDPETAASGLQVTAVAAYFADALRSGDGRWSALPGAPSLRELVRRADGLAVLTESEPVRKLADTVLRAAALKD